MPIAKLCSHPACRAVVRDEHHRCTIHRQHKRSTEVLERSSFYSKANWKKLSLKMRQIRPVCELCQRELTSDVDHHLERIVDSDGSYELDERNLVCLCKSCHFQKGLAFRKLIKSGDYNKIYQWCLNKHPRPEDTGYLHDWIKNKRLTCL